MPCAKESPRATLLLGARRTRAMNSSGCCAAPRRPPPRSPGHDSPPPPPPTQTSEHTEIVTFSSPWYIVRRKMTCREAGGADVWSQSVYPGDCRDRELRRTWCGEARPDHRSRRRPAHRKVRGVHVQRWPSWVRHHPRTWERDSDYSGKTGCKEGALVVTGLPRWHSRNPSRRRKRCPFWSQGQEDPLE